ncbi:hypothetical protein F9C28_07230 [Shimwellia pseudoproteus]|uniref:hypothetical protein n=1 Tax=Shimwellia pseudoproteus TaxID=570012 RepID=UPI0018ECC921|nr:hypothetical protein [Shimwellia pseudoproteus]MBJ3814719.1 hypothetical protein [Shimwellia pseudoproteus]
MFGIFTEDKTIKSEFNETVLPALIIIGDFNEGLQIPVDYWDIEQYYASWLSSLKKGMSECRNATLVVSMYSPEDARFLFSWVLYFRGENVIIQNKIVFIDEISDFSIEEINKYSGEYDEYSEGEKASEWHTTVDEVKAFITYLEGKILR